MQETLESPPIHRPIETFKLGVRKMLWNDDTRQKILVHYLPTSTMRQPANNMLIIGITNDPMKFRSKIRTILVFILSVQLERYFYR